MRLFGLLTILLALVSAPALAQKKEIVELQRDMALLQDQMKQLEKNLDDKLSQLTKLIQQAVDTAGKSNEGVTALQNSLGTSLREQSKTVASGVVGVSTKVDQVSEEVRGMREAIAETNARLAKLDQKIVDLDSTVRTINNPPKPPGPDGSTPPDGNSPPAGMSAETLYKNALADMNSGKLELALMEFQDYVKYFSSTELAPNAQFYIGEIHRRNNDPDAAMAAYDQVLEKYQENNKSADAQYMKARMLLQTGKRTAAADEFRELIKKYPASEQAAKAKDQLKALGIAPPSASRTPRKR